jgi:hypothetical protein
MLGVVDPEPGTLFSTFAAEVRRAWRDALAGTPWGPVQMDEPLWRLSRGGCRRALHGPCPEAARCPVVAFCRGPAFRLGSAASYDNRVAFPDAPPGGAA